MAVIQKCSFSGKPIAQGTGTMYVRKDGKILYFDSMKSQKNFFKLGRKARETAWTEDYAAEKRSRLATAANQSADSGKSAAEIIGAAAAAKAKTAKKAPAKAQGTQSVPARGSSASAAKK